MLVYFQDILWMHTIMSSSAVWNSMIISSPHIIQGTYGSIYEQRLLLQLTWKGTGVCHHKRHQLCWQFSIGRGEIWHGCSARVCSVYESGLTLDSLLSQCVRWTTTAFEKMTVAELREERVTVGDKKIKRESDVANKELQRDLLSAWDVNLNSNERPQGSLDLYMRKHISL